MAAKICRVVVWVFLISYVLALALFAIGAFGLLGQERDPLSAVFLIPLGLPWNQYLDGFADEMRLWLAGTALVLNALILMMLCRLLRTKFSNGH
ncbi:MAG: hypothetical protein AB7S74_17260 [Hyphomicrobium sp.]